MTMKDHVNQLFGHEDEELDKLNLVSSRSKYKVIQTILAHPKSAPSLDELKFANPGMESGIYEHANELVEEAILRKIQLKQRKDLPYVFYTLTDDGEELLEEHGIMPNEKMLKEIYDNVQKPDKIETYENAPRTDKEFEEAQSPSA